MSIEKILDLARCGPVEIVDVGAMSLGKNTEPYAELVQKGAARVTGFEPDPAECEKLNAMYRSEGAYRFFPFFIGEGGPAVFYETSWVATGSLYKPNTPVLSLFSNLEELVHLKNEQPVTTHRLDALGEVGDIDFLKLDCQGAALSVLRGSGQKLSNVVAIQVEVEFLELYEKQPLFADVDSYLRGNGFMFHQFGGMGTRCYRPVQFTGNPARGLQQMLWSDAVYIADYRRWETMTKEKLLRLALIAHTVYKSYDLAMRLFQIADGREGANRTQAYFEIVQRLLDDRK